MISDHNGRSAKQLLIEGFKRVRGASFEQRKEYAAAAIDHKSVLFQEKLMFSFLNTSGATGSAMNYDKVSMYVDEDPTYKSLHDLKNGLLDI